MASDTSAFRRYLITVLDNIKEAVALVDIDKDGMATLLLANKAFHTLTGYKTDSIGNNIYELVEASQHKFLRKQFEKIMQFKQPVEYIIWAKVPVGRRAFEVEMIPVLNRKKDVKEVIVMFRDVTVLAKLQEEVRALRAANYTHDKPAD